MTFKQKFYFLLILKLFCFITQLGSTNFEQPLTNAAFILTVIYEFIDFFFQNQKASKYFEMAFKELEFTN